MDLNLQASPVFEKNLWAYNQTKLDENGKEVPRYKVIVNEGGTGSGKTYSILQLLLYVVGLEKTGQIISIVSSSLAELRGTAMRDFYRILEKNEHYDPLAHRKGLVQQYFWNGNTFEFIGMDKAEKKKSARRDILYMNEANSQTLEDWFQLSVRTRSVIFMDYNPSETQSWIYEHVIPREDCYFIHSTFLDNYDFLTQPEKDEITYWENKDDYYWQVYGLGLRADVTGIIYPNTTVVEKMPDQYKRLGYWLDFGFSNDPTSFGELGLQNGELWADELFYETGLTNLPPLVGDAPDILDSKNIHYHLRRNGVPKDAKIIADSAEPKSIQELYMAGWNVHPAPKGPDSVKNGIDIVKRYRVNITERSTGLLKERKFYKWAQDKEGNELQKPVDRNNHSWDGIRYVCLSEIGDPGGKVLSVDIV